jgi:hypothetical protein
MKLAPVNVGYQSDMQSALKVQGAIGTCFGGLSSLVCEFMP